jgi:hypothetical protein
MLILFLDDDDRRHKEFKRAAVGHVVHRAFGAREAIRLLGENAYDRVYLDYDLDDDPEARGMDDYESGQVVADWLAENAAGRHDCLGSDPFRSAHAAIPVVVVSACLSRWFQRPAL